MPEVCRRMNVRVTSRMAVHMTVRTVMRMAMWVLRCVIEPGMIIV